MMTVLLYGTLSHMEEILMSLTLGEIAWYDGVLGPLGGTVR